MQLLQPHYFEYWIKNQYLAYYLIDIVLKSKSWYRIALATATCAADLGILADDIIMGCDFSNLKLWNIFISPGRKDKYWRQELEMVNQIVAICDTAIAWYCIGSPWHTSCVPIYILINFKWMGCHCSSKGNEMTQHCFNVWCFAFKGFCDISFLVYLSIKLLVQWLNHLLFFYFILFANLTID